MRNDAATDPQLPLAASIRAVHEENGRRLRALLRRTMEVNSFARSHLSFETGRDLSHLARMLDDAGGAHPDPAVVACVIAHDPLGVYASGICAMCGREAVRVAPDPAAENERLRAQLHALRAELDRLLEGT